VVDKQALSSYKRREKEIYTLWLIQEKKKRKKGFHTHEREAVITAKKRGTSATPERMYFTGGRWPPISFVQQIFFRVGALWSNAQ
jgi:hypothetical protein